MSSRPATYSRAVFGITLHMQPDHVLFFEPNLNLDQQFRQRPYREHWPRSDHKQLAQHRASDAKIRT